MKKTIKGESVEVVVEVENDEIWIRQGHDWLLLRDPAQALKFAKAVKKAALKCLQN